MATGRCASVSGAIVLVLGVGSVLVDVAEFGLIKWLVFGPSTSRASSALGTVAVGLAVSMTGAILIAIFDKGRRPDPPGGPPQTEIGNEQFGRWHGYD